MLDLTGLLPAKGTPDTPNLATTPMLVGGGGGGGGGGAGQAAGLAEEGGSGGGVEVADGANGLSC